MQRGRFSRNCQYPLLQCGDSDSSSDEGSVVSIGGTRTTFFKRRKVKSHSLQDMSDALRHRVVLALQEAGILDRNERLTEKAIKSSNFAVKEGSVMKYTPVVEELTKDGSPIEDWEKRKTQTIKIFTGQRIQVHFYRNKVTGEVNYTHRDFKVKNSVDATLVDGNSYKKFNKK